MNEQAKVASEQQYPRIASYSEKSPTGKCYVCGRKGAEMVTYVQVGKAGVSNEVYRVHAACAGDGCKNVLRVRNERLSDLFFLVHGDVNGR